jgi:hypothetical protein
MPKPAASISPVRRRDRRLRIAFDMIVIGERALGEAFPNTDDGNRFAEIFKAFDRNEPAAATVTLSEVSIIKMFCDTYYLHL